MAVAGNAVVLSITTIDTAYVAGDELDGINNVSFGPTRDKLDTTDFKDGTAKKYLMGLTDGAVNLSGQLELGAATVQQRLITGYTTPSNVFAHLVFNPGGAAGYKGFKVECVVESFSVDGVHDGIVEVSYTLGFTGPLVLI